VAVAPEHITVGVDVVASTGSALTVTVANALLVLVQPEELVPVTLYVFVMVGEKAMPFVTPPVHV
jgi:hypothetical protein